MKGQQDMVNPAYLKLMPGYRMRNLPLKTLSTVELLDVYGYLLAANANASIHGSLHNHIQLVKEEAEKRPNTDIVSSLRKQLNNANDELECMQDRLDEVNKKDDMIWGLQKQLEEANLEVERLEKRLQECDG